MMQLLTDLKAVMLVRKMSMQKLADKIHKDVTTVAKQLDPNKGNPTLASIIQIADALDARLVVETEESMRAVEESDVSAYRDKIVEQGAEIARLHEELGRLREAVADRDARIAKRDVMLEDRKKMILAKDEDIRRKDAALAKLIAKQEELYEKLMGQNK